ncbi:MAG: hypothetical protein JO025_26175 [Verrucomicrobia bacterium]|nr:hypothetical protein [Verrucomicrobiota bacterium]
MAEEIIVKRRRGRPRKPPHLKTRRVCFRIRLPDPDLLQLYAKLAGYSSVNAYTQSAFDALANQWQSHPEVQALLSKKAEQKTEISTPLSLSEISIENCLSSAP